MFVLNAVTQVLLTPKTISVFIYVLIPTAWLTHVWTLKFVQLVNLVSLFQLWVLASLVILVIVLLVFLLVFVQLVTIYSKLSMVLAWVVMFNSVILAPRPILVQLVIPTTIYFPMEHANLSHALLAIVAYVMLAMLVRHVWLAIVLVIIILVCYAPIRIVNHVQRMVYVVIVSLAINW